MPPKAHATLSASSSERWLNCPPSARLCENYEDRGSDYAAEGTDAHSLCEFRLQEALGLPAENPIENLSWYNTEMEECATSYAAYVVELLETAKQTCSDPVVMIEQRVDFSHWVQDGFGTADCIVIADGVMNIVDYKHGNTISDSCFVLGAYSALSQYIYSVLPGTYTVSIRAKKTSTMSAYVYISYNGNKTKYLFSKSTAFGWTDYTVTIPDVTDPTLRIYCYSREADLFISDIMLSEGSVPRKWTPAPNEIYTAEVKIDRRGIEVSNNASSQRTVITNTEFAGYYNDEVIFTLNKDETVTKKTTVDGELTVGKTKFVPLPTASEGLNIVILD